MKKGLLFLTVFLLSVGTAGAAVVTGLYDTGVDDSGARLGLNVMDSHWGVDFAGLNQNAYTTGRNPNWIPADPYTQGRWITPQAYASTGSPASAPEGWYNFFLLVDIAGLDSGFQIDGFFASDNPSFIYVNGVYTGITGSTYWGLTPFSITSGFNEGLNSIAFAVYNLTDPAPGTPGANPTGLLVDFTTPASVPEPSTMLLLGSGLLGLAGYGRRRFKK